MSGGTPAPGSIPVAPASAEVRYRIEDIIGEGALAVVAAARDLELSRPVALKLLKKGGAIDEEDRRRFFHEAEVLAGMDHPAVPPVYARGALPNGMPFYAMRLVRGSTLRELLKCWRITDMGRNEERAKLVDIFEKVCGALAHAHAQGIIHRDIKPSNIMVGEHGEVHLLDWGLAKTLQGQAEEEGRLTRARMIIGTPAYMSPEQASGRSREADCRSDVFMMGIVLYEMLCGHHPFPAEDPAEIRDQILAGVQVRPRDCDRRVPPELDAICMKALAAHPDERYRDAQALEQELQAYAAGAPLSAYRPGWIRRTGARIAARPGTSAALMALAAAILLLAGAGGGYWQARRDADTRTLQAAEHYLEAIQPSLAGWAADASGEQGPWVQQRALVLMTLADQQAAELKAYLLGRHVQSLQPAVDALGLPLAQQFRDYYRDCIERNLEAGQLLRAHYAAWRALHEEGDLAWSASERQELEALRSRAEAAIVAAYGQGAVPQWGSISPAAVFQASAEHIDAKDSSGVR